MSKWKLQHKYTFYLHSIEWIDESKSLVHLSRIKFSDPIFHLYSNHIDTPEQFNWNRVIVKDYTKKLSKKWIKKMEKGYPNNNFGNHITKTKMKIKKNKD